MKFLSYPVESQIALNPSLQVTPSGANIHSSAHRYL